MSEFVKELLKNWVFVKLFSVPTLFTLDSMPLDSIEKRSETYYIVKDFKLNDSVEFSKITFDAGSTYPGQVIGITFTTDDPIYYTKADYFFDSNLNDWEEYGDRSKLRGVGRYRKNYAGQVHNYKLKISVSPTLYNKDIYYIRIRVKSK